MSINLVMPSNHLILCRPLLLLPSIFPSIRVSSNELVLTHENIKGLTHTQRCVPQRVGILKVNLEFCLPLWERIPHGNINN